MKTEITYNYINLYYLDQMSEKTPSFMIEMIDIYKSQVPMFQNKLKTYFETKDIEGLKRTTHKIKGALSIMGVNCLDENLLYFEENENILLSEFETFIQNYIFTCKEVDRELNLVINEYKNKLI